MLKTKSFSYFFLFSFFNVFMLIFFIIFIHLLFLRNFMFCLWLLEKWNEKLKIRIPFVDGEYFLFFFFFFDLFFKVFLFFVFFSFLFLFLHKRNLKTKEKVKFISQRDYKMVLKMKEKFSLFFHLSFATRIILFMLLPFFSFQKRKEKKQKSKILVLWPNSIYVK